MKYYIIVGEASGDLHGSNLMKGLYAADPEAVIRFRGGDLMQKVFTQMDRSGRKDAGLAHDYREGAVMGFFDVIKKGRMLLDEMEKCREDVFEFRPDAVILIDYPGFNLKMAKWAHNQGMKVFYYIAPKVWASRESRIHAIRKYVDKLFIIFPFEKEYFTRHGVDYIYLGNPLVDAVDSSIAIAHQNRDEFLQEIGLHPSDHVVAMLAGSRLSEVKSMMPLLRGAAAILHAKPRYKDYKFVIAGAPGRERKDYGNIPEDYMSIVFDRTQQIVRAADAAVINSGTASLEAALLGTPQVVVYDIGSKFMYYMGRLLVKCKFISLGNLCLDRLAFKEFYRPQDLHPEVIAAELENLLTNEKYRRTMMEDYTRIRSLLGGRGASVAVAHEMVKQLQG